MDRNDIDWTGVMPAIVTPFDAQGRLDEAGFCRGVELCIDYGCTGVVTPGCAGESWALSRDERKRLFELAVDTASGRIKVLAGTSAITQGEVIDYATYAKEIGCDGQMVISPFFPRLHSHEDFLSHYRAISDAVKLPIMMYNVPAYNLNELTPELTAKLADVDMVVAIKESTPDWGKFHKTLTMAGDRIKVFTGQLSLFGIGAIMHGSDGVVTGATSIWGAESVEFYNTCVAGDGEKAVRLQNKAIELWDLCLANNRNLYPAIKAGMNLQGLPGGYPRPPLRPLNGDEIEELRVGMQRLGFDVSAAAAAE